MESEYSGVQETYQKNEKEDMVDFLKVGTPKDPL